MTTIDSHEYCEASLIEQDDITRPANCCIGCIYLNNHNREIFESLCKIIKSLDNNSIATQLSTFCNCLALGLQSESFIGELPEMIPQIEEDEVFLEWIFKDFRLGFLFCSDQSESGWTATVNSPDHTKSNCARFNGNIPAEVTKIVSYILRLT